MSKRYYNDNKKAIKRGFQKIALDGKRIGRFVVGRATSEGSNAVITAHYLFFGEADGEGGLHTSERNTHAYAMAEKGVLIDDARFGFSGGSDSPPREGKARQEAEDLACRTKADFVGVVLSAMDGPYREDYEEDFMHYAISFVKDHAIEYVQDAIKYIGG